MSEVSDCPDLLPKSSLDPAAERAYAAAQARMNARAQRAYHELCTAAMERVQHILMEPSPRPSQGVHLLWRKVTSWWRHLWPMRYARRKQKARTASAQARVIVVDTTPDDDENHPPMDFLGAASDRHHLSSDDSHKEHIS